MSCLATRPCGGYSSHRVICGTDHGRVSERMGPYMFWVMGRGLLQSMVRSREWPIAVFFVRFTKQEEEEEEEEEGEGGGGAP